MNEKPEKEIKTLPIITKFCMTIGQLPTSYLMSMTYLEQVTWLCNFLEKQVIPAVNQNGEAVKELQNLYELLRTYVNEYFDNLDVQEEINKKLDEMVEAGTLEQIIEQYLNSSAIWGFDTIEDLKNATNLINGSFARTLGYYNKNDGGSALYKVRTITNEDVVDEMTIIALNDNTLVGELIIEKGIIGFNQLGAKGDDNTFNNTPYLLKALNIINTKKLKLLFSSEDYYFSTAINNIALNNCCLCSNISSTLHYTSEGWFITFTTTNNATIENLRFNGNSTNKGINFGDTNSYRTSLKNVQFNNFTNSAYIGRSAYFYIDKCNFYANTSNDILLELGQRVGKHPNELITINDSIFAGGESLDSTGDFIRINQLTTLRITNSDFANTLGRWLYVNNASTGDIYDIQIVGCTFTRAKNGIVFDLTTASYLMNIIFDKPLFSLYGNWNDGETNIVTINRTGEGAIQNGMFRDVSITRQNTNYSPSHFIYDSSNSTLMSVNFIRRPNVTNYINSGVRSINQSYTLTAENNVTLGDTTYSQNKITNLVSYTGRVANGTESSISAYTELASGFLEPLGGIDAVIIGITNDGTTYPFFIENGHLKCRKSIPTSTNIRINATYTTKNN